MMQNPKSEIRKSKEGRRSKAEIRSSKFNVQRSTFKVLKGNCATPPSDFGFRPSRSAFTLVEILIALSLLCLVIAGIYSSWTAILRGRKVGLEAAAAVQRSRMTVRMLEDSLGSARAFAVHAQMHPDYYAFLGDKGYLSFVARLAKSYPRSGKFGEFDVRRLQFELQDDPEGGQRLVLSQKPLLMEEFDKDEKERPLVLARYVRKFEAEFWDAKQNDWVEKWDENYTNALPKMVKITLAVADKPHSLTPPDEIVRIISLPAMAVAPSWQSPFVPRVGAPGGGPPGSPPGVPPVAPPGAFQNPINRGVKPQ
jgi:prepilin-type N-terminal cleavage/methylation domain-containing protein